MKFYNTFSRLLKLMGIPSINNVETINTDLDIYMPSEFQLATEDEETCDALCDSTIEIVMPEGDTHFIEVTSAEEMSSMHIRTGSRVKMLGGLEISDDEDADTDRKRINRMIGRGGKL